MTNRGQLLVVGLHALLALGVLVSMTLLAALHDPVPRGLASIYGIIIGIAGASAASVAAIGVTTNGKATVPPLMIAEMQRALREAVDHLAGARQQIDDASISGGRRITDPPPEAPPATAL